MEAGSLSYTIELDNRRYFDTTELMRVFGQLDDKALNRAPKQKPLAQVQTDLLTQLVEEVRLLRHENKQQSAELKSLAQENKTQADQLVLIRQQLEQQPLLPAPAPKAIQPEPQVPEPEKKATQPGHHEYTSLLDKLRGSLSEQDG